MSVQAWFANSIMDRVINDVRPYTATPIEALEATIGLTLTAIDKGIPGDLVECGTWMGGCSFAMLLAQRYAYGEIRRPVWMYDSFEGMSPPCALDGAIAAEWWAAAQDVPKQRPNNDYCIAPIEHVRKGIRALDLEEYAIEHQGWFTDAGWPGMWPPKVAVLRVDCDWYDPVKSVLDHFVPYVSPGGSIIIDDYYAWPGAALATHEYLAKHKLPWPLTSIAGQNGATLRVQ